MPVAFVFLFLMPSAAATLLFEHASYTVVPGDTLVLRTNFDSPGGRARFQELIRQLGVEEALVEKGIQEGNTVKIGELEFAYYSDRLA